VLQTVLPLLILYLASGARQPEPGPTTTPRTEA
jgi:hypothetical protein